VKQDRAQRLGELGIVGEDRAAIAIGAQRLGRKEAGGSRHRQRADPAVVIARAVGLRAVAQHPQPLAGGDFRHCVIIGGNAEKIDRDDADGFVSGFARRGNGNLQRRRVHVEGVRVDIDEPDMGAKPGHHFGRRDKGEGRAEDRLARTHVLGHQHHRQRVGTRGTGDGMLRPAMGRQLRLKLCNLGPHDVLAVVKHPGNRGIHPITDEHLLSGQIDKTDRFAGRG